MGQMAENGTDFVVDVESGRTNSEDKVGSRSPVSDVKLGRSFLAKVFNASILSFDGLKSESEDGADKNVVFGAELPLEKVKILIGNQKVDGVEAVAVVNKKMVKEKRKSTSAKKPPKPPRPPRGLSLDAADQKLIKEIAELAMLKRARIERMKALKRMKAAKASSSGNFLAMLFTVLFCIVIIFQGMSSGSVSVMSSHGSMKSVGVTEGSFTMFYGRLNPSAADTSAAGSEPPNHLHEVSRSDSKEKMK